MKGKYAVINEYDGEETKKYFTTEQEALEQLVDDTNFYIANFSYEENRDRILSMGSFEKLSKGKEFFPEIIVDFGILTREDCNILPILVKTVAEAGVLYLTDDYSMVSPKLYRKLTKAILEQINIKFGPQSNRYKICLEKVRDIVLTGWQKGFADIDYHYFRIDQLQELLIKGYGEEDE